MFRADKMMKDSCIEYKESYEEYELLTIQNALMGALSAGEPTRKQTPSAGLIHQLWLNNMR